MYACGRAAPLQTRSITTPEGGAVPSGITTLPKKNAPRVGGPELLLEFVGELVVDPGKFPVDGVPGVPVVVPPVMGGVFGGGFCADKRFAARAALARIAEIRVPWSDYPPAVDSLRFGSRQ